jgi:hypothetical protein
MSDISLFLLPFMNRLSTAKYRRFTSPRARNANAAASNNNKLTLRRDPNMETGFSDVDMNLLNLVSQVETDRCPYSRTLPRG